MTSTVAAALFALAIVGARADVEDKITKSFNAPPGGQLVVNVDRGSIEIRTADRDSVDIEVARKAGGSQSRAEQILKDHVVTITQDGNTVSVRAEYKGAKLTSWFGNGIHLQVRYQVTIPRNFNVDLKTAGGSIGVAELTGKVQAHTAGGSLEFKRIEGPLSAHTSGGSISVAGCKGSVDLGTSGGSLNLSDITGDITAHTSGGSIRADKLTGKSVVKTSGGSIRLTQIKGQIDARTSGGSITAELQEEPAGDCTFETSGGSVSLALNETVEVDVDAHTSAGQVSTDLPVATVIQGGKKRNELRGKINGGGPLITLRTSAGSIRLQKK